MHQCLHILNAAIPHFSKMSRYISIRSPISPNARAKQFSKHTYLQRVNEAVRDVNDGRLTYKAASEKYGLAASTIARRVKGACSLTTRRGGKMKVSEEVALEAVSAVKNKEMSVKKASKTFKLSEKAIRNRLKASEELKMLDSRMQSDLPLVMNSNCLEAESFDNVNEMSSLHLPASIHGPEQYRQEGPKGSFQIVGDIDSLPISKDDLILALQTMSQQSDIGDDVPQTIIVAADSTMLPHVSNEESAVSVENMISVNKHGVNVWNNDTSVNSNINEFPDNEESRIAKAVHAVRSKKLSALSASKDFGLPHRMILKCVAKSILKDIEVESSISAEHKDCNLLRAIKAVLEKKMTTKEAEKMFDVKRKAISCRLSGEVSLRGGQSKRKVGVAEATKAVLEKNLTLSQACKAFKVPKSSVFSRLKRMKERSDQINTGSKTNMQGSCSIKYR